MPRDEIIQNIRVLEDPEADDKEKETAAHALANEARKGEACQSVIVEEGGLMPLVALLEGGPKSKTKAAFALRYLAEGNDKVGMAIVACGGREALEALANCQDDQGGKDHALEALKLLPADFPEPPKTDLDQIRKHVQVLESRTNTRNKGKAAMALGDLAQHGAPTQQAIEAAGALEPLIDLLGGYHDYMTKLNAAFALRWLAFNNLRVATAMVVCGAREPLEKLENAAEWADDNVREGRVQASGALKLLPAGCPEEDLYQIRKKVQVLRDLDSSEKQKAAAAMALGELALHGAPTQLAIEAAKGVPLLVAMLGESLMENHAAYALHMLAMNPQVAKAIVACGARQPLEEMRGEGNAMDTLKLLPDDPKAEPKAEQKTSGEMNLKQLKSEVKALETGSKAVQCRAAEQLGTWAAISDENRGAINRAGGCEALVALVVNGSDDAKWHAARALRNLANHAEAKKNILKADGIAILTPIAKHGKGKVKEAAGEALNLLSSVDAKAKAAAEPAATPIPIGARTRVAMFSARFDGGPIEKKFRQVFSILRDHQYDVLMVAADAGESFGDLTTQYLGRLKREEGTMLAVCTKNYGEMTESAYSAHKELKFALDYEKFVKVLPLKVEETYPPEPAGGPQHKYDKDFLAQSYILSVFKPCVVYLDCQGKSEREIAAEIANYLQKYPADT